MSNLLWRYYLEDDIERFQKLLASGHNSSQHASKGYGGVMAQSGSMGAIVGSPAAGLGISPRSINKNRKSSANNHGGTGSGTKSHTSALGRSEVNSRDQAGLTILHRAVSSTGRNAVLFALALIEHPTVDLYVQDLENGWTALHRSLYFGNVTIARAIMDRDSKDSSGLGVGNTVTRANSLIKIKDNEGNSAFDVYNATIARRILQHRSQPPTSHVSEEGDDDSVCIEGRGNDALLHPSVSGDEVFAFGSNKNLTLGFGDEDDRQHPEKINLKRPEHLLFRFHREHLSTSDTTDVFIQHSTSTVNTVSDLPAIIRNRPIVFQDVALSKLHSAILTTDPESNLYMCGFGPGGRVGTGDETTRFTYVCIEGGGLGGKKVSAVALGQNHSIVACSLGEVFTWGTNTWGQLGYNLPRPALQDEEPINTVPRQIFGPLKREIVLGVAASAIHSVAFTSTSLFTWGKNEGQLGLMDSDSRSLEAQVVPRRVAASLFASSIQMVSAINRATVCLLANHTVYVFTNYGYNNVKFPMYDGFSNYHLNHAALTTRHEPTPSHISSITSGGETIAAVSSRGDLFTFNVTQKVDSSPSAASTTNPAKIRNALTQPQRIWSLRKGHWDGIKSVGVSENGSVIICTQAGAVWRRIRRAKIKDTYLLGRGESKNKDYKFQRVPGLTKVVAVRSNAFGAYAALRRDCDVTQNQIIINQQDIWKDLAQLFILRDLQPSGPLRDEEESRFWKAGFTKEHFDPFKRAFLVSPDPEGDIFRHIRDNLIDCVDFNLEISTNLSDISIPVHAFMFAARSPILRDALSSYRKRGSYSSSDILAITGGTKPKIVFHGVDFLTILNLAVYVYNDNVVDVWHFTRHAPKSAFRYRQVRTELMKLASKLGMNKLESAARLMSAPEPCLNKDLAVAFTDPKLFEDGDTVIELDNGELTAHGALLRQRCPFFDGLFNGRAAGKWLVGRREVESEPVKIDMKHVDPSTFQLVLRYLYSDAGSEIFDGIVTADANEFCDIVIDVMSVANELMLDRLSQICQQMIGRFVNTRNICHLINTVAPCSVTEFKDAGFEYLCLQLETMLENHLLDELDEELIRELDEVVRDNQLACLPFAKSGRAEMLLHERHPTLAQEIDEDRQRKIRDMVFRSTIKDDDSRLSSSFRARVESVDDMFSSSPSQDKLKRKSKTLRNAPFSPAIRPQDSKADLMFDMDDEDSVTIANPTTAKQRLMEQVTGSVNTTIASEEGWRKTETKCALAVEKSPFLYPTSPSMVPESVPQLQLSDNGASFAAASVPWSSIILPSSKLDMRDIMAQASRGRTSSLSISLSAEKAKTDAASKAASPKMSQKERRKQQQTLQQAPSQPPSTIIRSVTTAKPSAPWRIPSSGPIVSLKDVLDAGLKSSPAAPSSKPCDSPVPGLAHIYKRTASPDTRFAGQRRPIISASNEQAGLAAAMDSGSARQPRQTQKLQESNVTHGAPYSRSYTSPVMRAEPPLQLSMADIIGQQKLEQDLVKEAVAKRSLQEIQEEQAFQEWWDQESKRAQEEEALRARTASTGDSSSGSARGKGGKRGRGGVMRGRGNMASSRGRGRGRGQDRDDGSSSGHKPGATVG